MLAYRGWTSAMNYAGKSIDRVGCSSQIKKDKIRGTVEQVLRLLYLLQSENLVNTIQTGTKKDLINASTSFTSRRRMMPSSTFSDFPIKPIPLWILIEDLSPSL